MFNLVRHFSLAAYAIEANGTSRSLAVVVKRLVEFGHDSLQERAVTVPVLNEDHKRFFGKAGRILGDEFVFSIGLPCHAQTSSMWSGTPHFALD